MTPELERHLRKSISAGLDYILTLQATDGHWTDWNLPPGTSLAWTTGYVGFKLDSLPEDWSEKAASVRLAASNWLLRNQFPDGGWGYNESVGSDADSTAFAILCLTSAGLKAPDSAYNHLTQYHCSDGGFSTYYCDDIRNSWGVSHPDVTPVVLRALLTTHSTGESVVSDGLKYVLGQKTKEGIWNSFWWDSHLYSTEANLSLLTAVKGQHDLNVTEKVLCQLGPAKVFEVALLISSLLHLATPRARAVVAPLLEQLIRQQQPDGSWISDSILRIVNRDCFKPWACANAGPVFSDPQRLFTSSAALAALSMAYSGEVLP